MRGFYIDPLYLVLVAPAILFATWASWKVNSTFNKYSAINAASGTTAEEACQNLLNANGISDVTIGKVPGELTDHYDPTNKVINLSESVYGSTSVAAIGVACHEAGHAIQDAKDYAPMRLRDAIIPVTRITSSLSMPLVIGGVLLSNYADMFIWVAYIGLIGFFMAALFQLITLPAEFDASKRALASIDSAGYLTAEELKGSKQVLDAAALTYVSALAVSLMSMITMVIKVLRRERIRF